MSEGKVDVFKAVKVAIEEADKFLVEVGVDLVPVSDERVPAETKAKYLRTVLRGVLKDK